MPPSNKDKKRKPAPAPSREHDHAHDHDHPAAGQRNTRQRRAIQTVLAEAGVPLSPKEILDGAQSHVEGLGLATVYRTLKLLAEEKLIEQVEIPGEGVRYELAGKGHHHHFYCRSCGKVSEVHGCPGDFAELAPKGYKLDGHELVLFGRCAPCVKRK